MNDLEKINSSLYTHVDEYRLDCRDPRYAQDTMFNNAIQKKLERSWSTMERSGSGTFHKPNKTIRIACIPEGNVEQPIEKDWDERGVCHETAGGLKRITLRS